VKLKYVAIVFAALVMAPLALVHGVLRASLPQLDGDVHEAGLTAPVRIGRDRLGVPTIDAANRTDLAYATGFVHGQDRFFQMDLSRRLAAGELAELFGKIAIEQDRTARLFRFRHVAREVLEQTTPEQRAVLEAYARGVNAGLASLHSRPWEYWALGSLPAPWRPEDSALVVHAMWWDLQANGFRRELLRRELNMRIGGKECDAGWKCGLRFLYPDRTAWDAPDGVAMEATVERAGAGTRLATADAPSPDVPAPDVLDVRSSGTPRPAAAAPIVRVPAAGSNNWAVAGRLTATGAALVAGDMHLTQRVPVIWYHARLRTKGTGGEPAIDLNGVTLPGAPLLVAGSNGHIAWSFTNSYGNWLEVERVPCTEVSENGVQTPSDIVPLSVEREEIRVRGAPSVVLEVKSGASGVLWRAEPESRTCWFASWLAQIPAATNFNIMGLERAASVEEALALAPAIGIPHQNAVLGDREGHIAWTIFGRIPTDTGSTRASGRSSWTTAENHPRIVDPPVGRIWTANARVTSDKGQEAAIGGDEASLGAEYDLGARASQIRDDLLALKGRMTPADMLRIQLDDRAVFLTRWRELLLRLIDEDSVRGQPRRAEFKRLLANWNARASVDSVGYRLVRDYHERTQQAVWEMIVGALKVPPEDGSPIPMQFEEPLWRLVNEQPMHMLAAEYPSWREFLLAQLDASIAELDQSCGQLARCTWGSRRVVHIQHPISRGMPFLSPLLDMPAIELPGDHDMPRVQDGPTGASERFAVSPGHEDQGYYHMPGGQSGHPLSPYYRAGFLEWARGEPLPFLPGPTEHTLALLPSG
jgi:penicillin G amidase